MPDITPGLRVCVYFRSSQRRDSVGVFYGVVGTPCIFLVDRYRARGIATSRPFRSVRACTISTGDISRCPECDLLPETRGNIHADVVRLSDGPT